MFLLTCARNGLACKDKWGLILGKFKIIFNYNSRTRRNKDYNAISSQVKNVFHLL
jgi:hypothetical protein